MFVVVTMHSQVQNPEFRTVLAHRRGEQSVFGGCCLRMENTTMNVLLRLSNGTRLGVRVNTQPVGDVGPRSVRQRGDRADQCALRVVLPIHQCERRVHRAEMHSRPGRVVFRRNLPGIMQTRSASQPPG